MRRVAVSLLLMLFGGKNAFTQVDERVKSIQQFVSLVNHEKNYTIKNLEAEEFMDHTTDGGGELTGYFKNGELIKIVEWIGLSSCITVFEYYIQNKSLVFVYGQEKIFSYSDSLQTFDPSVQTVGMECRFYFNKEKIFKKKLKGATRCSQPPIEITEKYLLDSYNDYLKKLSGK